jgi:hypothetical protein
LQTLNVLRSVRVDALEGTDELVVETLDVGDDAAGNLDVLLTFLQGRRLFIIVPLLGVLNNNVVVVLLEDLKEA